VKSRFTAAICVLSLLVGSACASAAGERKLLIGVIDQVTWSDLLGADVQAPAVQKVAQEGGVGLMCVRTAGGAAYLTIGAGTRALEPAAQPGKPGLEGRAFSTYETVEGRPAAATYYAYTGERPGGNAIVHPGIGGLVRANAEATYPVVLGLLGSALREAGLRVACVGNADTADARHREAAAIAMDRQGLVEFGDVGSRLTAANPAGAHRLSTDREGLLAAFRRAAAVADVVVVDFGETSRAASSAGLMSPGAAAVARARAVEAADRLLAGVLAGLSLEQWGVLLLAPTARASDPEEQFANLTPVIFRPPGRGRGLLTSPSTRRPGLVVNTDVAATVLDYFGIAAPAAAVGRPMRVERVSGEPLARVKTDEVRQGAVEVVRRYVFRWVAGLSALALWAAAGLMVLGDRAPSAARRLVRGLLLLLLSAPPALLVVGLISPSAVGHLSLSALGPLSLPAARIAAIAVVLTVVLAQFSSGLSGGRAGHVVPSLALVGLLIYDLWRGGGMLEWSPLSYSAAGGARFYGVGNEYAGALLGAALVGAAALLMSRASAGWGARVLTAAALLACAAFVGHPRYGANLGMALGCAVGFGVFALYLWRDRPTGGEAFAVLLVAGLVAAAAVSTDLLARGGEASHVGRFVAGVKSQGWVVLVEVVARKWAMSWALVRASLWTDAAVAALGVVGVLLIARPPGGLRALERQEWLGPALTAAVAGAIASLVLNDSGIVAAALVLLYGAGSLAYLGLAEE